MKYVVKPGDSLISIAATHGISDWKRIWNRPENATLRRFRDDAQILAPGDEVFIPEPEPHEFECEIDKRHVFRLKKPPECFFSLYLKDEAANVIVGAKYELAVGGQTFAGTTGPDGLIAHPVPPTAQQGKLRIWVDPARPDDVQEWPISIGHLDPVDSVTGVQARLNNLGFNVGTPSGVYDQRTREAVREFQRGAGLEPNGELDDRTRDQLQSHHNEQLR